ncbi:MAG: hypothetical protein FD134_1926 [Gallionellaceae bacterium]|nr:MAG: hypothetical protein FD134_1926 [Gallionellaceae bacterium]
MRPLFRQRGFTYLGLMFLVAVIGIGLAQAGVVWQTEVQREREAELLFIGEQYALAIGSYYENTPGGARQYPNTLEDLLRDPRFPETRRHLRRIYSDPVTGTAGFPSAWAAFASSESYADWQFVYAPGALEIVQPLPEDSPPPDTRKIQELLRDKFAPAKPPTAFPGTIHPR